MPTIESGLNKIIDTDKRSVLEYDDWSPGLLPVSVDRKHLGRFTEYAKEYLPFRDLWCITVELCAYPFSASW